jgi:hypothetical protein
VELLLRALDRHLVQHEERLSGVPRPTGSRSGLGLRLTRGSQMIGSVPSSAEQRIAALVVRASVIVGLLCVGGIVVLGAITPSVLSWSDALAILVMLLLLAQVRLLDWQLARVRKRSLRSRAAARMTYGLTVALPLAAVLTAGGFLMLGWVGAVIVFGIAGLVIALEYRKVFPRRVASTVPD